MSYEILSGWRPIHPMECALCGTSPMEMAIPIRLTAEDLDAIASAVAAKLQPNFDRLSTGVDLMSQSVSQQLADLGARLDADVADIRADIDALSTREATPEDIANLKQKIDNIHAAVGDLNNLANPPPPPAP